MALEVETDQSDLKTTNVVTKFFRTEKAVSPKLAYFNKKWLNENIEPLYGN